MSNTEFKGKRGFEEHYFNVHEGIKPFKCDICGLTFARKQRLNKHKKCHEHVKCDVKCDLCEKSFTTKKGLNRHKEYVHNENTAVGDPGKAMTNNAEPIPKGKKPFHCTMCDTEFEEKRGLNEHVSIVHKKQFKM
jgi:KRAB domain-containing zinc finger protein